MNFYETIFILDAAPEAIDAEIKKVEDLITTNKGEVVSVDRWGMRKLAYEIKRKGQGFYTCIYFKGDSGLPAILENQYKLNENCLRYLTVVSIQTPEEILARAKKTEAETPATAAPKAEAPAAAAIPVAAAAAPADEGPEETPPLEEEPAEPEATEAVEEQAPETEKPAEPLAEEPAEAVTPEPEEEPADAEAPEEKPADEQETEEIPQDELEDEGEEEEKKE